MPQKFIRKNPHKKSVRPASRFMIFSETKPSVEPENKQVNEQQTDMNNPINNIEQLKAIVGDDTKLPKRKVKVEKKDKGLIERTENSTILITEDNKMMLND